MKRLAFVTVYVLALGLSHIFPFLDQGKPPPSPDQGDAFRDAWQESGISLTKTESATGGSTIVLLVDPRDGEAQTDQWYDRLPADSGRVLAPRTRTARAKVANLIPLLDERLAEQVSSDVHIVAIGASGPLGIQLAVAAPHLIHSLTLISATGVQEFQHLGDHHINHAIYWAQEVLSWTMRHLIPHFGAWNRFPWDPDWIDHLRQSDLRQVRDLLAKIDVPVLIIHQGTNSRVPFEASNELHRLLPHSQMTLFHKTDDASQNSSLPIQDLRHFWFDVQNGTAASRQEASEDRLKLASIPFDGTQVPPIQGRAFWITLVLIALATLISEDLTCISAGLMVSRGLIGFFPATIATLFGIFFGDILLFLAGRWIGQGALKRIPLKWLIDQSDIERSARWFDAKGPKIIIASRFLPGSRLPTYFGAGMMGAGFWMFTIFFFIACVLWTPVLVGVSALVGKEILAIFAVYERLALPVLLMTVALLLIAAKIAVPLFTFKGRRLLRAAWIRKTHWEFWPPYVFYIPVFVYVIYLGIRHRCMTLFTAANPAIPTGGFVGESKSLILSKLCHADEKIAQFETVDAELSPTDKAGKIRSFMEANHLDYPIVLKPDVGERGFGVTIVRDEGQLLTNLDRVRTKTIAQEYVPGVEFGVFYYRVPGQPQGRIFSITDKQFLAVTGDGASTLEELILKHERAMAMAPIHMKAHRDKLYDIPKKGQRVELVEVGTHCRGSVFLDGNHLLTPELELAFDRISRSFDGFYFGRYDIRCISVEAFQHGSDFKILELNGVTSEATHIYDPNNGLFSAYGVLKKQWRIAFEIGAENRKRGFQPTHFGELVRSLSEKFSRQEPAKSKVKGG